MSGKAPRSSDKRFLRVDGKLIAGNQDSVTRLRVSVKALMTLIPEASERLEFLKAMGTIPVYSDRNSYRSIKRTELPPSFFDTWLANTDLEVSPGGYLVGGDSQQRIGLEITADDSTGKEYIALADLSTQLETAWNRIPSTLYKKSIKVLKETLLEYIRSKDDDAIKVSQIWILRKEIAFSIENNNQYYTGDWINLLTRQFTHSRDGCMYPACDVGQLLDYQDQILQQAQRYAFIPLNVPFDQSLPEVKNHWVALIIDKSKSRIFYLDPARKTHLNESITQLYQAIKKDDDSPTPLIECPIDFQRKEKEDEEGWIRHCGVYVIEIFRCFFHSMGSLNTNDRDVVEWTRTLLSAIPSGEADRVEFIRHQHIREAYQILVGVHSEEKDQAPRTLSQLLKWIYTAEKKSEIAVIKHPFYDVSFPIQASYIDLALLKTNFGKSQKENQSEAITDTREQNLSHDDTIYTSKTSITLTQLFDERDEKAVPPNHLLIEGRVGSGKTKLCHYVLNQWALDQGTLSWGKRFEHVIWLSLRQLLEISPESSVRFDEFVQTVLESVYPDMARYRAIINGISLEHLSENTLFLLDGFDEVTGLYTEQSVRGKLLRRLLEQPYWILTSRPYTVPEIIRNQTDRHIENLGFLNDDIIRYVKQFFKDFDETDKTTGLLNWLTDNLKLQDVVHIPINLELLCSVWKDNYQAASQLHLTMTDIYQQMTLNLLKRYLKRLSISTKSLSDKKIMTHAQCQPIINFLTRLAWEGMQQNKQVFSKTMYQPLLEPYCPENEEKQEQFHQQVFKDFGLLKGIGTPHSLIIEQPYSFIHLSFQEYLAAKYLQSLLTCTNERHVAITFITSHRLDKRYETMWCFLSGLLSDESQALQRFFEILLSDVTELNGSEDMRYVTIFLPMRCYEESVREGKGTGLSDQQEKKLMDRINEFFKQEFLKKDYVLTPSIQKAYHYFKLCPSILDKLVSKKDVIASTSTDRAALMTAINLWFEDKRVIGYVVTEIEKNDSGLIWLINVLEQQERLPDDITKALKKLLDDVFTLSEVSYEIENRMNKVMELYTKKMKIEEVIPYGLTLLEQLQTSKRKLSFSIRAGLIILFRRDTAFIACVLENLAHHIIDDHNNNFIRTNMLKATLINVGLSGKKKEIADYVRAHITAKQASLREFAIRLLFDLDYKDEAIHALKNELVLEDGMVGYALDTLIKYNAFDEERNDAQEFIVKLSRLGRTDAIVTVLKQRLSSSNEVARNSAMAQLERLGRVNEAVVEALRKNLGLWDEGVRNFAMAQLERLDRVNKAVVEALRKNLASWNEGARNFAMAQLKQLNQVDEVTVDALRKNLSSENKEVRDYAVKQLRDLNRENEVAVIDTFRKNLGSSNEKVRVYAVQELIRLKKVDESVITALRMSLSSLNERIRDHAMEQLRQLNRVDEAVIKILQQNLSASNLEIRMHAVRELIRLNQVDEAVIGVLRQNLSSWSEEIRAYAVQELIRLKKVDESVITALRMSLSSLDEKIRDHAMEQLRQLNRVDGAVIKILWENLSASNLEIRMHSVRELIRLNQVDEAVVGVLRQNLSSWSEEIRAYAVQELIRLKKVDESVITALRMSLSSLDEKIRDHAMKQLKRLGRVDEAVAVVLRANLSSTEKGVRNYAMKQLRELHRVDQETITVIRRNISSNDPGIQDFALQEMCRIYDKNLKSILFELLNSLEEEFFSINLFDFISYCLHHLPPRDKLDVMSRVFENENKIKDFWAYLSSEQTALRQCAVLILIESEKFNDNEAILMTLKKNLKEYAYKSIQCSVIDCLFKLDKIDEDVIESLIENLFYDEHEICQFSLHKLVNLNNDLVKKFEKTLLSQEKVFSEMIEAESKKGDKTPFLYMTVLLIKLKDIDLSSIKRELNIGKLSVQVLQPISNLINIRNYLLGHLDLLTKAIDLFETLQSEQSANITMPSNFRSGLFTAPNRIQEDEVVDHSQMSQKF